MLTLPFPFPNQSIILFYIFDHFDLQSFQKNVVCLGIHTNLQLQVTQHPYLSQNQPREWLHHFLQTQASSRCLYKHLTSHHLYIFSLKRSHTIHLQGTIHPLLQIGMPNPSFLQWEPPSVLFQKSIDLEHYNSHHSLGRNNTLGWLMGHLPRVSVHS